MDSSSGAGSGGSDPKTLSWYHYDSQRRRDWNTFLQYLRNHNPPLPLGQCGGDHVIEFLRYLDQFGMTKVHLSGCPYFGNPDPPASCDCPLRQACGSLYALIGRLRAAYEENGGQPETNPFAAFDVTVYLQGIREDQARACGIPYEKKNKPDRNLGWLLSELGRNWKVEKGNCDPSQSHPYPTRPGEPDCIHYLRTGFCRFGSKCHFNHPAQAVKPNSHQKSKRERQRKWKSSDVRGSRQPPPTPFPLSLSTDPLPVSKSTSESSSSLPSFASEDKNAPNDNIMEEIKDDLPKDRRSVEEMKSCCSIFFLLPQDYEFQEDTLIQLWMAGGYIEDELLGQEWFRYLLNKEYVLRCGSNFVTRKDKYQMNIKKIEDLLDGQSDNGKLHLKWENKCHNNRSSAEIQHVSLVCRDIDASMFKKLQQFNELRTLLFLRNYGNKVTQIPDHLFQSFKELRALDLSGTHIKKLPSSVGYMIRLHYLDLSWTLIEWLPDIICSLEELQTLKLRGCSKLRGLPRQLKKLTKLRHLDVDVLRQLATIPKGIGALVNLQTLSTFLVGTEEGCKIQELKELNNLRGDVCIAMLENVGNADEAKEAALSKKQHINKLELRWTASQLSRTDKNCFDVLEYLQPCSSLKELQIFCYESFMFPDWVNYPTFTGLNQLISITFFKCEHVIDLPLIEHLPFLKQLELVKLNGVEKIERRGKPDQAEFSSLEKLEIDEMQNLKVWSWVKTNEGDFKSLVELTINDCPGLSQFHVLPSLSSIKHLEVRGCPKVASLSETRLPDSLEDLIVEDCPMIKKKCSPEGGEDWQKIQHVSNIRICEEDEDDDDDHHHHHHHADCL